MQTGNVKNWEQIPEEPQESLWGFVDHFLNLNLNLTVFDQKQFCCLWRLLKVMSYFGLTLYIFISILQVIVASSLSWFHERKMSDHRENGGVHLRQDRDRQPHPLTITPVASLEVTSMCLHSGRKPKQAQGEHSDSTDKHLEPSCCGQWWTAPLHQPNTTYSRISCATGCVVTGDYKMSL